MTRKEIQRAENQVVQLWARICLYAWATNGGGHSGESFARIIRKVIQPDPTGAEELNFDYPDGMTAQECRLTVDAVLKDSGIPLRGDFAKHLRTCYSQPGNHWLFGLFPTPPVGRSSYAQLRKDIELEVGCALWDQRPVPKQPGTTP